MDCYRRPLLGESHNYPAVLPSFALHLVDFNSPDLGGEPDGVARLPELLSKNGFIIRSGRPHVFCLRPNDYMWQWPATFIEIYLPRLIQMGRIDQEFADKVRADLVSAEKDRNALMLTPLVLEIVAERMA